MPWRPIWPAPKRLHAFLPPTIAHVASRHSAAPEYTNESSALPDHAAPENTNHCPSAGDDPRPAVYRAWFAQASDGHAVVKRKPAPRRPSQPHDGYRQVHRQAEFAPARHLNTPCLNAPWAHRFPERWRLVSDHLPCQPSHAWPAQVLSAQPAARMMSLPADSKSTR